MKAWDVSLWAAVRLSLLVQFSAWIVMLSWQVFVTDHDRVVAPLLVFAVPLLAVGAVLRWYGVPGAVAFLYQLVVAGALWLWWVTGSPVPTGTTVEAAREAVSAAVETARRYAAPVSAGVPPVSPLLWAGGLGVLLCVEVLAGWLGRMASAALVLLVTLLVPGTVLGADVSLWIVGCAAAVYLLALYRQHLMRLGDWGRGAGDEGTVRAGASLARAGAGIGAVAVVGSLVLSGLVGESGYQLFDGPGGRGGAPGVRVGDPVADMRRDLRRSVDEPLLQLNTDGDRPDYLRLTALTEFDGVWRVGPREVPGDQTATGQLPAPPGLAPDVPTTVSNYGVSIGDGFNSRWLPALDHTSWIEAGEDWRYDLSTRDFLATGDASTIGARYRFANSAPDLDAVVLDQAGSSSAGISPAYTDLPGDLADEVTRLADEVVRGAGSEFEKARKLQEWFRRDGGFRYDLSVADSLGSDSADLLAFLDARTGRVGYCEQFAASMAVMARTQGIPARVAVGFLTPEEIAPDTYEFSAWDMHAWPELYFPGAGWVRFEPTPSNRASQVPDYTRDPLDAQPSDQPTPTTPTPTTPAPTTPDRAPRDEQAADARGQDGGAWVVPALGALGGVLVLGLLAAAPRAVRRRRREERLGRGAEGLWEELRASALDLGLGWPAGLSPRREAAQVERFLATGPAPRHGSVTVDTGRAFAPLAAAALDRLVACVEDSRYGPAEGAEGSLMVRAPAVARTEDLDLVVEALSAGVTRWAARRATWLPASLWRARR